MLHHSTSERPYGGLVLRAPLYRTAIVGLAVMYAAVFHFSAASICDQFGGQAVYRMCVPAAPSTLIYYSLLAIVPAMFLPSSPRVSSLIIFFVYVMHVFPSIAIYPYIDANERLGGLFPIFESATFSLLGARFVRAKNISLPRINVSRFWLATVAGVSGVLAITILYFSFDFSFQLVSLFDVYDVRSEFKNQLLDTSNPFAAYLVTGSAYALAPALVILSKVLIRERKVASYALLGLGVFLSLSIYALAAFKSGVFIIAFTILICYFPQIPNRKYMLYTIFGFGAFALMMVVLGVLDDTNPVFAHWYRRAFVVPGIHTNLFYNYIGNSISDGYPGMPSVVSRLYYGTDGSANSGLYGDGLARAGFVGAAFTVTFFGILLKIMDAVTTNLPSSLSTAFFLPTAYALSNSSTTSVMLTYGAVVSLICAYMLNEYLRRSRIGTHAGRGALAR